MSAIQWLRKEPVQPIQAETNTLPIHIQLELRQILRAHLSAHTNYIKESLISLSSSGLTTTTKQEASTKQQLAPTYKQACSKRCACIQNELKALFALFYEHINAQKIIEAWQSLHQSLIERRPQPALLPLCECLVKIRADVWRQEEMYVYLEKYARKLIFFVQCWESGDYEKAILAWDDLMQHVLLFADFLAIRLLRGRSILAST